MEDISLMSVFEGFLLGLGWSLWGWQKNKKPEKFNPQGLLLKVPTGILIGIYASLNHINLSSAEGMLSASGAINGIDYGVKLVWRRFLKKFGSAWKWEVD